MAAPPFTEKFAPALFAPRAACTRTYPEPMNAVKPAVQSRTRRLANAWKTKAGRDLTEAELLAMPDSEYMKRQAAGVLPRQAAGAEGRPAVQRRRNHRTPARRHLHRPRSGRPRHDRGRARAGAAHPRPRAQAAEEDLAVAGPHRRGDYGYCDETGEPIGLGRLLARPTATLSLEAQQRRELKQKMFGD